MTIPSKVLAFFGYVIRILIVITYAGWVFYAGCLLGGKDAQLAHLQYFATRDLPVGYWLRSGDVKIAPEIRTVDRDLLPAGLEPIGKYVSQFCSKGQQIPPSDLSTSPIIKIDSTHVKYLFPLERQKSLAEILNAGSRVDICGTTCLIENVRVVSIVCDGNPPNCFSVLDLSKEQAASIVNQSTDKYSLIQAN